jgi:hypothetical protein
VGGGGQEYTVYLSWLVNRLEAPLPYTARERLVTARERLVTARERLVTARERLVTARERLVTDATVTRHQYVFLTYAWFYNPELYTMQLSQANKREYIFFINIS